MLAPSAAAMSLTLRCASPAPQRENGVAVGEQQQGGPCFREQITRSLPRGEISFSSVYVDVCVTREG